MKFPQLKLDVIEDLKEIILEGDKDIMQIMPAKLDQNKINDSTFEKSLADMSTSKIKNQSNYDICNE